MSRKFLLGVDDGTGLRNLSPLSSYGLQTLKEIKEEVEFNIERLETLDEIITQRQVDKFAIDLNKPINK